MTILKDVADITRGLTALDRRYEGVPGWEKLHERGRLRSSAETCLAWADSHEPDYTIDRLGWRPNRPFAGSSAPGLAGVIQAQHNLLLGLGEFPSAHSLRMVLDSQRVVTHEVAQRIPGTQRTLAASWAARRATYSQLVRQTRNLSGDLGTNQATGAASIAASRARKLGGDPLVDITGVRQLDRLFTRIDDRLCAAIEHGVRKNLYFLRAPLPCIDDHAPGMAKGLHQLYVPITSPVQTDLLALAQHHLRPPPIRPTPPRGATRSRLDFEAALGHRPGEPGPVPRL